MGPESSRVSARHLPSNVRRQSLTSDDRNSHRSSTTRLLPMCDSRFRVIARVMTRLLLLWTVFDLTHPNLCALDQESRPVLVGDAAPQLQPLEADSSAPMAHVDDCFCCSTCVTSSAAVRAMKPVSRRADTSHVVPFSPMAAPLSLYHPPRV